MNQPDDFNLVSKAFEWAWAAVLALLGVVWRQNERALEQLKADNRREHDALSEEQETQRQHIAKLFDKIEAHAQRSEDRHLEILNALHQGLSSKADK